MMTDAFDRAAEKLAAEQRQRNRDRTRRRRGRIQLKAFRIHATAFLAVQILIFAIWVIVWRMGGTAYPWFVYPLLGWGIALAVHWSAVRDTWRSSRAAPAQTQSPATGKNLT